MYASAIARATPVAEHVMRPTPPHARARAKQQALGNQAALRQLSHGAVPRRIVVGDAADAREHEADRAAEAALRSDRAAVAPGGAATVQRACDECEREGRLDRSADGAVAGAGPVAAPSVHAALASGGQPLDASTRAAFEPSFGYDLGSVRVHTDDAADRSARDVHAIAYTVGRDVVFRRGAFAPGTRAGQRLLAHELAHVVQQSGGAPVIARQVAECGRRGFCGEDAQCAQPDPGRLPPQSAYTLDVNLDLEAASFQAACDALGNGQGAPFGHAFVRLVDPTGAQYTYGFYPRDRPPNQRETSVPGCVVHPDTGHDGCVDYRVRYTLTQPQFAAALAQAVASCRNTGAMYSEAYTCTSFVLAVSAAAGHPLPAARGSCEVDVPGPYNPTIRPENPNTLVDSLASNLHTCETTDYQACMRWAAGFGEMRPLRPQEVESRRRQCAANMAACQQQRAYTRVR